MYTVYCFFKEQINFRGTYHSNNVFLNLKRLGKTDLTIYFTVLSEFKSLNNDKLRIILNNILSYFYKWAKNSKLLIFKLKPFFLTCNSEKT